MIRGRLQFVGVYCIGMRRFARLVLGSSFFVQVRVKRLYEFAKCTNGDYMGLLRDLFLALALN